jgi:hypothetical protein
MSGSDFVVLDMGVPAADLFLVHSFCWHATAHFGVALGTSKPRACMIQSWSRRERTKRETRDLSSPILYISFRFGARDSFCAFCVRELWNWN